MKKQLIFSVVISTYNRARLLQQAIDSLFGQTFNKKLYEVVIVDNNSNDTTETIVAKYQNNDLIVRYFLENKQGASHGRNRGIQEAKGEYIAFIDDDCVVPPEWLDVAYAIIEKESPVVFGGAIYPYVDQKPPKWYKVDYHVHKPFDKLHILTKKQYGMIYGGNMFCKREALEILNGFDPEFGPRGEKIGFSEESELLLRIRDKFPQERALFDPDLYVYHTINVRKLTFMYSLKSSFRAGRDLFRISDGKNLGSFNRFQLIREVMITLRNFLYDISFNTIRRDRNEYPFMRSYFYMHTLKYIRRLGNLYQYYIMTNDKQIKAL